MELILRLVPEAEEEFFEALFYYESISPNLAFRFKNEVESSARRICLHPEHIRLRSGKYRRINLASFPYYLPFLRRGKIIWLIAVAHSKRKPHYWISRSKNLPQRVD